MVSTSRNLEQFGHLHANQAQLANLLILQRMQDYLKYLILNVSDASCGYPIPAQTGLSTETCSLTRDTDSNSLTPEETTKPTPTTKRKSAATKLAKTQKNSGHLWNLMVKKYSTKKIKPANAVIDPNERTEDGEVYRKVKGMYIPIIKHQTPLVKKENVCGHPDREHYARGLCGTCYHKHGRGKRPWNCPHDVLYALGLCHKCYLARHRQIAKEKWQAAIQARMGENNANAQTSESSNSDFQIKQEN